MAKINFTSGRISSFACDPDKAQAFLWDSKAPGLGLRATPAGAKSYVFQSKLNNKTVRVTIGDVRSWTIEKAQERARYLQTLVDNGQDPREVRAEQKAAHAARQAEARRQDEMFGDAWDGYVEARKPFWSERTYEDHLHHADIGGRPRKRGKGLIQPGPIAVLRSIKLKQLTGEVVAGWLAEESEKRPTMVALSFRLVRGFIRWANEQPNFTGLIPTDAYQARNVKDALPRVKAKEGDALQREQLKAWFAAVRNLPNPVISVYLQGLLIMGPRREEWASLKWTDVDFKWRSVTLDDKVEGTAGRTIPLPPYMAAQLLVLKQLNAVQPSKRRLEKMADRGEIWTPSPWVFHSPTAADGKLAEPRIAHEQVLKKAELPHVSLHGLRRSFGTLSEWCEVPVGVVAQIQGHKPSAIAEKHYRRRPIDLLRKWHDKIEAWILEQAEISFTPDAK
jgi:integrase